MITLTTTVYEKDFRIILNKENWFYNYKNDLITKKNVIVNNIQNIDEFISLKKEFENDFNFFYSSDYLDKINQTFNLNVNTNEPSYYYSVQHYTNILINENKYSFYVGADCTIVSNSLELFLKRSIDLLKTEESVMSTTLPWVKPEMSDSVGIGEQGSIEKLISDFYLSKVFSDQVYFIDTDKIKKADFTITERLHPIPEYGINGFEYRLTNHLITNNNYRAIYKGDSHYIHKSI